MGSSNKTSRRSRRAKKIALTHAASRTGQSGSRIRAAPIEALENRTFLSADPGPSNAVYTAATTEPPATRLDPNNSATLLTKVDDAAAAIDIGNNKFTFYGVPYSHAQIFASTNGLITLGGPFDGSENTEQLTLPPAGQSSLAAIAPLWDDWSTHVFLNEAADGQVLWRIDPATTDGTPARLIVQWNNVVHFFDSPSSITFQAILTLNTPGNGSITFNYPDLNSDDSNANGQSATVGIRNADPSPDPLIVSYNGSNALPVATGKAILISPTSRAPAAPVVSASDVSGDEGSRVPLSILAAPTDQDRSERLDVQISGVPDGVTLSAGTRMDNGVWSLTGDELASLTLTSPDELTAYLTVTATALDATNVASAPTSATFRVDVQNVAPTISNLTTTVDPVAAGTGIALASAEFTDPGVLDTHTATWDWGDGMTSDATLAEPGAGYNGAIGGAHTYTAPGTYTVRLTVADHDGGQQTLASKSFVVVYDPSAGFVTGGGWIDSPAGAYATNPSAAGKGRFGFVSKYQNGTTTPIGQTQFTLNIANLNFHSTAYDWMVVSGGRADYHGTGTINGQSGYHFQLTAIDGSSTADGIDRVRLRIWCDATGALVYDNGLGAAGDYGPGTALAGGSVVIHG